MLFAHERAIYTKTIISDLQATLPFCSQTIRGVLRIYNLQTEKTLLLKSENFTEDIQKIRFSLDLRTFPNKALQDDYAVQGRKTYRIESLLIAEKNENLDKLLQQGKEKLQELDVLFYQS
jgi:hypothetical protein